MAEISITVLSRPLVDPDHSAEVMRRLWQLTRYLDRNDVLGVTFAELVVVADQTWWIDGDTLEVADNTGLVTVDGWCMTLGGHPLIVIPDDWLEVA